MASLFTNRRAQQKFSIASIGTIAIAILVVVVILSLNTTILEKIKKTADDNLGATGNLSLTWAGNNTPITLDTGERLTGGGILWNASDGSQIDAADWFVFIPNGTISIINSTNWSVLDTSTLNFDGDTFIGSSARNISGFGIDGQTQLVQFVPTIAIVAMAAVVIGIILVFFGRRKEDEAR